MIASLAGWLFAATWKGSLLLAMAVALHQLGRNRIASRWLYALLLVALARLFLPVAPGSPLSLFNLVPAAEAPAPPLFRIQTGGPLTVPLAPPPAQVFVRQQPAVSPIMVTVVTLWAAGFLFAMTRYLLRTLELRQRLRRAAPVTSPDVLAILEECRELLGVRRAVALKVTGAVDAPSLHGWLSPAILLPALLEPAPLRHVLMHELAHLRRSDVLANWVITVAHALHWFNPLVHFAVSRLAEERELACDALALEHLRGPERSAYGGTVLRLLDQLRVPSSLPTLVGMTPTKRQMKRRILMIARFRQRPQYTAVFAVLLCVTAFVTLTDARAGGPVDRHYTNFVARPISPAAKAVMERLNQNVTLTLQSVSVDEVIRAVSNATGTNVTIPEGTLDAAKLAAKVTIKADNVPAHVVLLETLATLDLAIDFNDAGVQVVKGGPMLMRTADVPGATGVGIVSARAAENAEREQKEHDEMFYRQKLEPGAGPGASGGIASATAAENAEREQKEHDEMYFRQQLAPGAGAGEPGRRMAIENTTNEASDGVVRRKVTFRGEREGQPDGTFELEVRRADLSPVR